MPLPHQIAKHNWFLRYGGGDDGSTLDITGVPVLTATRNRPYAKFRCFGSGGQGPYAFSLTPGTTWPTGLSVNASTGRVSGTPTQNGTFAGLRVRVTDALAATDDLASFTMVVAAAVAISGTPVTNAVLAQPYAGFTASVTGGTAPITYALVGTWPNGLSVDASGHVAGTPTQSGSFTGLSVSATDVYGSTNSLAAFDLTVQDAVGIIGTPVTTATLGQAYTGFDCDPVGGTGPYLFTKVGAWPAGLALNPTTGVVSGTPTLSGTYAGLSVRVADSLGSTADLAPFQIVVALAVSIFGTPVLTATNGRQYTGFQAQASGGTAPILFEKVGTWPNGLNLNSATGVVSGAPTQTGSFAGMSVKATDAYGSTAQLGTFTLVVAAAVGISGTPVLSATLNRNYTGFDADYTGGTAPVTFTKVGTWPSGLTLNAQTGVVAGKPTQAGTFAGMSIAATDVYGSTASLTPFTLVVAQVVNITGSPVTEATEDEAYLGFIVSTTGGTAPVGFALTGTWPNGISVNGAGLVSGTPTESGTFNGLSVKATDVYGSNDSLPTFSLNVQAAGSGDGTTVLERRMIGGQMKTYSSFSPDAAFQDLMLRTKNVAKTGAEKFDEAVNNLRVDSIVRVGGVANVTLKSAPNAEHTLRNGHRVISHYRYDTSFEVDHLEITVADQTHFSFPCAGPDKTITAENDWDIVVATVTSAKVGASGHPIEDWYAIISEKTITDLNGTYRIVFPGSQPASFATEGGSRVGDLWTISGNDTSFLSISASGVPGDGSFRLPRIISTDASMDQTGATLLRPAYKEFLSRITAHMRMLDLGKCNNNSAIKSWDRRPSAPTGQGLPLEQQIDLCNECNCALWLLIPIFASADYILRALQLVRDRLKSGLRLIVEYGNENWNSGSFAQWHWLFNMVRYQLNAVMSGYNGHTQIASLVRSGGTVTATLRDNLSAYGVVNGQNIAVSAASFDIDATAITVTGAKTFTYADARGNATAAGDRAIYLNASNALIADGQKDMNDLVARMHGQRHYEISLIVRSVFAGQPGRAETYLMWEIDNFAAGVNSTMRQRVVPWLESTYGERLRDWCGALGAAAYNKCGNDGSVAAMRQAMLDSQEAQKLALHNIRYLASRERVKAAYYEGGPDFIAQTSTSLVNAFFIDDAMREVAKNNMDVVLGMGGDEYNLYQGASMEYLGTPGDQMWGMGRALADGGGPIGAATAKRVMALDQVLVAGVTNVDVNALPGDLAFQGGASYKDELGNTTLVNSMRKMTTQASIVETSFYAEQGTTVPLAIVGKMKNAADGVRVYLNEVLAATVPLFNDGTGLASGTAGGTQSPGTFTLAIPSTGYHLLTIKPPATIHDEVGLSKIAIPA